MTCVAFFGGCQLATIGILGEYLGRTLDQVKGRPLYIVRSACGIDSSSHARRRDDSRSSLFAVWRATGQSGVGRRFMTR